jgi:hypothetical protein
VATEGKGRGFDEHIDVSVEDTGSSSSRGGGGYLLFYPITSFFLPRSLLLFVYLLEVHYCLN